MRPRAATEDRHGIESQLLTTLEHLVGVKAELEVLLDQTGAPPPARWETIEPWFRHHPRCQPWAVLVWSGGELVAAALMAHTRRLGAHRFTTAGPPGAASWLAATTPAAAQQLARAVHRALDDLGKPWVLDLRDLPTDDPAVDALRRELRLTTAELGPPMARICFSPDQPLSSYLSRNTKSAVAKALNRIRRAGMAHELVWTRDPHEIDQAIGELVVLHRKRSLQQFGASPLDDPSAAALFRDIVHLHAHAARVRLLTLRIGESLAAFALCEEAAGTLWIDTNRASPDWLTFSPGTVVNAEVVRAAHADPAITCIDWGGSVQRYKLSGGNVSLIYFQNVRAWSSRLVRVLWALWTLSRRPAAVLAAFGGDVRSAVVSVSSRPRLWVSTAVKAGGVHPFPPKRLHEAHASSATVGRRSGLLGE